MTKLPLGPVHGAHGPKGLLSGELPPTLWELEPEQCAISDVDVPDSRSTVIRCVTLLHQPGRAPLFYVPKPKVLLICAEEEEEWGQLPGLI